MGKTRRDFLRKVGGISAGSGLLALNPVFIEELKALSLTIDKPAKALATDEDYWEQIQKAFSPSPDYINLENGYFSPQPKETLDALVANIKYINSNTSYYMRRKRTEEKEAIREKLAKLAGVSPEEIAITRNTTESLDIIISGLDLAEGDEAVMTNQDYSSMIQAFDQQSRRFKIKQTQIEIPILPKNKMEIVRAYEKAITDKTKVFLISHVVNATGTVLPVKEVAEMAHQNGIELINDAAHSFAHLNYKIPDLNSDYLGASLHKWLCNPLGAGLLYIKKEKIAKVWPLMGDASRDATDIRKFEHNGTQPVWTWQTISNAIDFHESIGAERKQERLKYLKHYWTDKVKDMPEIEFNTPLADEFTSAIANIKVKGHEPKDVAKYLLEEHNIWTTRKPSPALDGVRITPHLYTKLSDLDTLVSALHQLAKS